MLPSRKEPFHPHSHDPKIKGCALDMGRWSKFLRPGDTYTDPSGRKYYVAEDGSLRRVEKDKEG